MKKYMPLEGLRWSRDSGSALCDTSQNSRSRTGWGETLALKPTWRGVDSALWGATLDNVHILIYMIKFECV